MLRLPEILEACCMLATHLRQRNTNDVAEAPIQKDSLRSSIWCVATESQTVCDYLNCCVQLLTIFQCCGEPVTLKNLVCMLHAANNLYSSKASDTQHSYDVCAEQNTHRLPAITSKSSCQSQSVLLSGHVCIAGSDTHATRRHDGNTRTDLHLVDTQPSETESASESSSSSTSSQDSRSSVATSSTVSNQREIAAPGMRDSEASCGDSNTAGTTRLPSDFDTGHPMISNTIQVYETQSGHASLEVVDAVANAGLPGVGVCQGDRIAARRDSSCEGVSFLPSVKRFVPLDVSKIKKQHGFSPTPLVRACEHAHMNIVHRKDEEKQ
eukprot:GHVQ01013557.1.p2 GENE.GHVQ01013557.1~~GHVQ01013557.1.p2  ORF type:complete len:324 (-),score=46.11 GHVQ01013557.1:448-1419(-)